MKKNQEKRKEVFELSLTIGAVILTALLTWLITSRSNRQAIRLESLKVSVEKEMPVYNRISDLIDECEMTRMAYITITRRHEVQITTYIGAEKKVVAQDTSYHDYPVRDTALYYLPKFIIYPKSYDKVIDDINFIRANVELLSHKSLEQVNGLLVFVEQHPVVLAVGEEEVSKSEWGNPEIYMSFVNKITKINQEYLKRLKRFGLY